ncbi:MAG: TlpA family protein disulfide reductase [Actinomycetota bacterium]|nr:TlpA family protein disulfide reductase [Actinomycetota bacterium]
MIAVGVVIAAALLGLLVKPVLQKDGPPGAGDRAPAFSAELLDGSGSLSLESLRGKPVLVNFWASWCVPCKQEAPWLRSAYESFGSQVAFVGIDVRDAKTDAQRFVEEEKVPYPSIRDEGLRIFTDYGLTGQPESFLIDADGTIVQHVPGAFPDRATLFQDLETLVSRSG